MRGVLLDGARLCLLRLYGDSAPLGGSDLLLDYVVTTGLKFGLNGCVFWIVCDLINLYFVDRIVN